MRAAKTAVASALLGCIALGNVAARAEMVSFLLDQSNEDAAFPDGVDYLRVSIEDAGADIRFTVEILDPLLSIAGANFGIETFGFNLASGAAAIDPVANIAGLPSGWTAQDDKNQDGFGRFELLSDGTGSSRQSPTLTFYVVGVYGDSPTDYVALSTGNANQGNQLFASLVAGFEPQDGYVTSAFFGGSTPPVVPLPAAAWLLLSALGGLGGLRAIRLVAGVTAPSPPTRAFSRQL